MKTVSRPSWPPSPIVCIEQKCPTGKYFEIHSCTSKNSLTDILSAPLNKTLQMDYKSCHTNVNHFKESVLLSCLLFLQKCSLLLYCRKAWKCQISTWFFVLSFYFFTCMEYFFLVIFFRYLFLKSAFF